ncbi:MAG TPA: tail fiber domain-containing protein [Gemmatimonadaceae bacterium]
MKTKTFNSKGAFMSSRFFRSVLLTASLLLAGSAMIPREASAQSDILLRLRSGSPPGDRFRVDSAGGVVAIGELGIGIIPASGPGYRMMWHPFKAAFRAGGTDDGGAGTYWDEANIGFYSWAGGNLTIASQFAAFAFGDQSKATAQSAVAFGSSNEAAGTAAFTAGALNNACGFGSVAIGYTNTTGSINGSGNCVAGNGQGSVAIGYKVTADCDYCVALGHRASANGHDGAFVIGDESTTDSVEASANNQFSARYAGGYRFYTNATTTLGVKLDPSATSFTVISDRNAKENFRNVSNEDVLRKIRSIPVSLYNYRDDPYKRSHIGPMAQDFFKAFPFNSDDKGINMSDLDGVNLAGVRALEARTATMRKEFAAELKSKDAKIADLEARIARLEALLTKK